MKRSFAFFLASVLMLGVLAGCSVFGKPDMYREARYYDEDGEYIGSEHYSDKGEYIGYSNNDHNDSRRITDLSRLLDTSEVAAMDGVVKVECRQAFTGEKGSGADLSETHVMFMLGYNAFGRICVSRTYSINEDDLDHPFLVRENVYETDSKGNPTHMVQKTANGDILRESWYENTYSGKRILSSEISVTVYGDGNETYDTPQNSSMRAEYIY